MLAAIRDPSLHRILGLGDTGTTAAKKGSTFLKRLLDRRSNT
jgi:hypothetical protein